MEFAGSSARVDRLREVRVAESDVAVYLGRELPARVSSNIYAIRLEGATIEVSRALWALSARRRLRALAQIPRAPTQ